MYINTLKDESPHLFTVNLEMTPNTEKNDKFFQQFSSCFERI